MGDEVGGGIDCSEPGCSSNVKHLTSWGRHLKSRHGYSAAEATIKVDAARQLLLGEEGEKFKQTKCCPMEECFVKFSYKAALKDHLGKIHGVPIDEIEEKMESGKGKVPDRYDSPVTCPKCPPEKAYKVDRQTYLVKHLTRVHKMPDIEARKLAREFTTPVEPMVDPVMLVEPTPPSKEDGQVIATPPATSPPSMEDGQVIATPPATSQPSMEDVQVIATPQATTPPSMQDGHVIATPPATSPPSMQDGHVIASPPATTTTRREEVPESEGTIFFHLAFRHLCLLMIVDFVFLSVLYGYIFCYCF